MSKFFAFLTSALLATMAAPAMAQVIEPPAVEADAEQDEIYSRLYGAMQDTVDKDQMLRKAQTDAERQIAENPSMALLEAQSPGLIRAMINEMQPVVELIQQRVRREYDPEFVAALRDYVTEDEAEQLTTFYRSPIGQRIGSLYSQNFTLENTLENASDSTIITAEQAARDDEVALAGSINELNSDDWAQMEQAARDYPALAKMAGLREIFDEIDLRMANEQPTAEEQRMLKERVDAVFLARFPD